MRAFIVILGVLLVACLVSSTPSPLDMRRWLFNRPSGDVMYGRVGRDRRASPAVKGGRIPYSAAAARASGKGIEVPLEYRVRKGEYVCGNKICKLTPGVEPKGCNGICQYPII